MTSTGYSRHERHENWEHVGRAAEDFARRVARDANKFAERMEEHAGEFARDAARDWRRAQRHCRRAWQHMSGPEVRRVFEDVRSMLTDVLEGVDELIERVFGETPSDAARGADAEPEWTRVITNRDTTCGGCECRIGAGENAFVRHDGDTVLFRCVDCGTPHSEGPASSNSTPPDDHR